MSSISIANAEKFAHASYSHALLQLSNTLLIYSVSVGLMFYFLPESYLLVLLISVPATIAHIRLFMIGHDCSHRSFLPKAWENIVVGNLVGILVNTPLRYWGSQHANHHRTTGNLDQRGAGDVTLWTRKEYESATPLAQWWYRMHRNPAVLLFIFAPIHFMVLQRWPLEVKKPSWKIWRSVMGTNIGLAIYYGSLTILFDLQSVLLVFAPIILFSSVTAVWLFYVQHQFDEAYWKRNENWTYQEATLKGSSFYNLPKWGHWATGNIGYHNIHHLNPRIPNYFLPDCYAAHSVFQETKTFGFFEGFRYARLAVWDEESNQLISFRALREDRPKASTIS